MVENSSSAPARGELGWRIGFSCLTATQFQTAFNDNALKFLVIYIVVAMNFQQKDRDFLVLIVGAIFALPFILFSMAGGYLADRYSKRTATIATKFLELAVMGFFILSLALHSIPMECAGVFLISTEAALFGPSKYGLLPEILPERRLSWGNGITELGTFLASITAVMVSGILAERYHGREAIAGFMLLGFSCIGLLSSFGISRVGAADPQRKFPWNPLGDFGTQLKSIRSDKILAWAVLGNTYLWFLAALLQFTIVIYGHDILHVDDTRISYLQAAVGIGIGLGSFVAGYLSGGKIEYGLIPLGAVGMTVFGALLYSPGHTLLTAEEHLALLGFSGGFFAVPLNALIQHRPLPERKGRVIAAANLLSFVGVFAAAGAYYFFSSVLHQTSAGIFLDGAVLTLITTTYSIYLQPDCLLRLGLWMLTHSLYRIRTEGRVNIPESGAALFVVNRMSLADALLLLASTDRPIRFFGFRTGANLPTIGPLAKVLDVLSISSQLRHRMLHSVREASGAIRSGEVVCIFAEGQITRLCELVLLRGGIRQIMKDVDASIVPVNLDGGRGAIFGFGRGHSFWKGLRSVPCYVTVSFGKPLPPTAMPREVHEAIEELQAEAYSHHRSRMHTLHRSLIRTAHQLPFRFAMGDKRRPRMKWGGVLLSSIFLARRLRGSWADQETVGILLPPSIPGALVNFAAMLGGKVPVNLNYASSDECLASCVKQCGIATVITTQALLDRIPLAVPGKAVLIEDAAAAPRFGERVSALLLWFLPGPWLERILAKGNAKKIDDLATIVFSSGSTGDPKGVMLTHYNLASNIRQVGEILLLGGTDGMLGVLPFFTSLGFMATLWLPATSGIGVVYHPSPLDVNAVSQLVGDYQITVLLATPALLQAYTHRCSPEDFESLRYVLVGSARLPERDALAFRERFRMHPLRIYGAAECSPIVAMSRHESRASSSRPIGAEQGHIVTPLPGISIRILDPETFERLPVGSPGLLLVRGPNIMRGYLGSPEKTSEVLRESWYLTDDIACEDENGSLTITDRVSRFSKIGSEMVAHIRIEELLHELVKAAEQRFVVTGIPDGDKGERLVVLHTLQPEELHATLAKLPQAGLPSLWTPRPNQFFYVEELPYLGEGKLDLLRIRQIALGLSSSILQG